MKQHITIEQLNELSSEGKNKLREWWKPQVGDFFMTRYSPTYVVYGRDSDELDASEPQLLTDQPVDSGYYGWNNYENFPPDERNEEKMERYKEVRKDALPLLSIGQMIEFIGEKNKIHAVWLINYKNYKYMCDTLWEIVKKELQNSS